MARTDTTIAPSAIKASGTGPANRARSGLGDIALLIGAIEGTHTKKFIELNRECIWTPPPLRNDGIGDKQAQAWRGAIPTYIALDGPILCHAFPNEPRLSKGWHHGAKSMGSQHSDEKPRDMLYPQNSESGISSSAFLIDYTIGPSDEDLPRIKVLEQKPCIPVQVGTKNFDLYRHQDLVLDQPAKITLPRLTFWVWLPILNDHEKAVFDAHVKKFYDRANRLEGVHIPGIASASKDHTVAPTPTFALLTFPALPTPSRRAGQTGTVYERDSETFSKGGFRNVFFVKEISRTHSGGLHEDQPRLVAKEIYQKSNKNERDKKGNKDNMSAKNKFHREMQENEWEIVMNNPHPHVNPIVDIAYAFKTDEPAWIIEDKPPWVIEEYKPYCLAEKRPDNIENKKNMMLQLVSAVEHYHSNELMHRDIKPENVLVDKVAGRWIYQFTDHGGATHTGRPVQGRQGTHFFCAPEVLDGEPYNENADIFSLGVLFLGILTDHNPFRDHPLGRMKVPESSADVQTWMDHVDELIRTDCPCEYQLLLRGMLLRNTEKRWSASKCLAFLKWASSERADQAVLVTLPWNTGPFTGVELEGTIKRKYGVFKRDDMDCGDVNPDGIESDDASTIIAPAAGTAGAKREDDVANLSQLGDIDSNSGIGASESGTLFTNEHEITSYQADMPITPRQGAVDEDWLASVPCTPLFDDQEQDTPPAPKRVVTDESGPVYDFTQCDGEWDWGGKSRSNICMALCTANKRQRGEDYHLCSRTKRLPRSRYRKKDEATSRPPKAGGPFEVFCGIFDWHLNSQIQPAEETKLGAKALAESSMNRFDTPKYTEFTNLRPDTKAWREVNQGELGKKQARRAKNNFSYLGKCIDDMDDPWGVIR